MLRDATILAVDAGPDVFRLLQALLEKGGFEILTACDLATAKQTALARRVDMILSDVGLPEGLTTQY